MFEKAPRMEDSILILKMLAKGYKVERIPQKLLYYREHQSENRMSGLTKKNIEGLENYRKICRKYYKYLNKKQINDVEYNFSKELVTLFIFNDLKRDARKEFYKMLRLKPLNKKNVLAAYKLLFPNKYKEVIRKKKNANKEKINT